MAAAAARGHCPAEARALPTLQLTAWSLNATWRLAGDENCIHQDSPEDASIRQSLPSSVNVGGSNERLQVPAFCPRWPCLTHGAAGQRPHRQFNCQFSGLIAISLTADPVSRQPAAQLKHGTAKLLSLLRSRAAPWRLHPHSGPSARMPREDGSLAQPSRLRWPHGSSCPLILCAGLMAHPARSFFACHMRSAFMLWSLLCDSCAVPLLNKGNKCC